MVLLGWLCFTLAAMPCTAAIGAPCCPGNAIDGHAIGHAPDHAPVTGHDPAVSDDCDPTRPADPAGTGHPGESCFTLVSGGCCAAVTPTLEDRSPPIPGKHLDIAHPAIVWAVPAASRSIAFAGHSGAGPPPDNPGAPRRHAFLCTFLD